MSSLTAKSPPKTLVLFRGIPGSGKTTAAELLIEHTIAADAYFSTFHGGIFDDKLIPVAHKWCRNVVEAWMAQGVRKIGVHNTLTRVRELRKYYELAEKYDYRVISLIVENRHGNLSVHGVPEERIERMRGRFDIKL